MFQEIEISGKNIKMLSSGATPIYYSRCFGKDCVVRNSLLQTKLALIMNLDPENATEEDLQSVAEWDAECNNLASELGYIMAMQAEKKKMDTLNEKSYIKWMDGFENPRFGEIAVKILDIYNGVSEAPETKKKAEQPNEK